MTQLESRGLHLKEFFLQGPVFHITVPADQQAGLADRRERRSSTHHAGGSTRRKPHHDQSTFLGMVRTPRF